MIIATKLINRFLVEKEKLLASFTSILTKLFSKIYGIQIQKGSKFYGFPKFKMYPGSSIQIASNCTFRSSDTSNEVGNNHRCIFTTLKPHSKISIGCNSGLSGVAICAAEKILIGNNVLIGANTIIMDHDGHADITPFKPKSIDIHDNVWVGMNSVILKGVTIGENSIIGANSVVRSNVPANVIAAGNPCKILMKTKGENKVSKQSEKASLG